MNTKRRIIVLVILVTAIILGVLTYTMVEGKTYTERFENIGLDRSSDNKVSVTLDREDIVEVTDCYVDDEGHPVISFSSLNAGIPFSIRVLTIAAALFLVLRSITAKSP